jgi:hypothetical protein
LSSGQSAYRKVWSGGDGKYESFQGGSRNKWNQYSLSETRAICSQAKYTGQWFEPGAGTGAIDIAVVQGEPGDLVTWNSNDDLNLLGKLSERVRGHSFNLAVATGEGKKTVETVVGALGTLARSVRALKHGDFATAARQLGVQPRGTRTRSLETRDVASRWLELQYGWKPLLSDVFDAHSAYHALTKGTRTSAVAVKSAKAKTLFPIVGPYRYTQQHSIRKTITYEMSEDLSAPRQLGLTDPLSLVWELLPYSFVIDWFYPIGSYLDNLAQIPHLKGRFMTSLTNQKSASNYIWKVWPQWPFPENSSAKSRVTLSTSGSYMFKKTLYNREPSPTLSVPMPSFDASGLRGNRVWNAIALAKIAFG